MTLLEELRKKSDREKEEIEREIKRDFVLEGIEDGVKEIRHWHAFVIMNQDNLDSSDVQTLRDEVHDLYRRLNEIE